MSLACEVSCVLNIVTYPEDSHEHDTAIARLLDEVYVVPGFTPAEIGAKMFSAAEVRKRGQVLLALANENQPVGMIILGSRQNPYRQVAEANEAEMQLLAVSPNTRGMGVGEALCKAFEEQAERAGFDRAVLSSQETMQSAHRLYTRLGYQRNAGRDWIRSERKFLVFEKPIRD